MDILVMENIFYNRDLFPVYDLKGSERARLARDDPSDPTRVLMDQNLIQSNLHDPILVNPNQQLPDSCLPFKTLNILVMCVLNCHATLEIPV